MTATTIERPQIDPNVPYTRLANAEMAAREEHPNAVSVRALWTPSSWQADIHVEVWANDERTGQLAARVVPAREGA